MPMNSDDLRDFAARYTEAWCSHDPARVASFFSEDGSLKVNDGEPAVGRDAIAEVAKGFMTAFPDLEIRMNDLEVLSQQVNYHWTLIGTNNGPGGTGNAVRITGYEEWKMGVDGKIAASLGHFDDEEYRRQLQHGD